MLPPSSKVIFRHLRPGLTLHPCGWSLIEILIVASILSVLIGVMVPLVSRATERSKTVKCQSNLRQIGVSLNLYKADYGQIPKSWDGSKFWFNHLVSGGYLPDARTLTCPAQKPSDPYTAMNLNVQGGYGMTYMTYWYPAASNTDKDPYFLPTRLRKPSEWPLIIDADYPQVGGLENPTAESDRQQRFKARHRGKANLLMMDGHIEQAEYGDKRWSQSNLNDGTKYY